MLCLVILPQFLAAQNLNLGTPPIRNFSKKAYHAGTQNWDIAHDRQGVMYFANNNGLLEFDGTHWRLHPLGNGTITRSVQMGADGRIYVGGQGDIGYFSPDERGQLAYHSLKPLLPESNQNFGDVWDILVRSEGVFFRCNNQILLLSGGKFTAPLPGKATQFMGLFDGKVLVQDADLKLHVFEKTGFQEFEKPAVFQDAIITAILPYQADTQLVTTVKNSIFYFANGNFGPWQTPEDAFLNESRIYCAGLLPDGKIALGTSVNGLVVLDRQRRIFHHLTKKDGLLNNTVLSLATDPAGLLWLGLDNGIDLVDINSPFSTIFPDGELEGTGYAAQVFKGKIYFGTNTGLYALDWKTYYLPKENRDFKLVSRSEGQVWSLNTLDNELLLGQHEGAFNVLGLSAQRLTELPGIWKLLRLDEQTALAGHYNGLAFFKKTNEHWSFGATLNGFAESSRVLEKDGQGHVWMSHPYRGVYQLKPDFAEKTVGVEFFGAKNGLPSDLNNYVFKLGDDLVFTGEKGVFKFDEKQQRLVSHENFNQIFGANTRVKYLRQDITGNIWYAADDEVGVLLVKDNALDKKVERMPIPELSGKLVGGFEFVLPLDAHNVFFATEQGFIHFDPSGYAARDSNIQVVLHEVRLGSDGDSLLFGGHFTKEKKYATPLLSSDQNSLRFVFSATDFKGEGTVSYAHFLEGAKAGWSGWSGENSLIFNNLRPGKYTFHLKARNRHGVESEVLSYAFEISPPWYASTAALAVYGLLLLALIGGALYGQRRRFEQERRDLQESHHQREEEHQLKAKQSEEAINRLENEKLEAEVLYKNQELATATMHLVQKSEILNTIQAALQKLEKQVKTEPDLKKEIGRIIRMTEKDASLDEDWEQFSRNFDHVHSDFLIRIAEQYPQLSPNDFKLCAYLRMNLSTKEIAALMNISVRGVEASRYRLRRRLDLDAGTNLTEFLVKL